MKNLTTIIPVQVYNHSEKLSAADTKAKAWVVIVLFVCSIIGAIIGFNTDDYDKWTGAGMGAIGALVITWVSLILIGAIATVMS